MSNDAPRRATPEQEKVLEGFLLWLSRQQIVSQDNPTPNMRRNAAIKYIRTLPGEQAGNEGITDIVTDFFYWMDGGDYIYRNNGPDDGWDEPDILEFTGSDKLAADFARDYAENRY